MVSDTVSNSLRVIKTYRQVNDTKVSYCEWFHRRTSSLCGFSCQRLSDPCPPPSFTAEAARLVVLQDGILGLFGRGLKTRIIANGLQGIIFSILWKLFLDL